jgi:hypothetical protein
VLPEGAIHPDLAKRLADEAARVAMYVLQMCIRAIDYCPPVGITFGDYLRGIITADHDINPEDEFGYRLAFIESFRQWGIYPRGMRTMSAEGLMWPTGAEAMQDAGVTTMKQDEINRLFEVRTEADARRTIKSRRRRGAANAIQFKPWDLEGDRLKTWKDIDENSAALWYWLVRSSGGQKLAKAAGLVLEDGRAPATVFRRNGRIAVEVHSVRRALRRTAKGSTTSDLVVEITQRRAGYFDPEVQKAKDKKPQLAKGDTGDFRYRTGCTLLIDPVNMNVRRVIRTPGDILDNGELERQRRYLFEGGLPPNNAYEAATRAMNSREPFAMLHRHGG